MIDALYIIIIAAVAGVILAAYMLNKTKRRPKEISPYAIALNYTLSGEYEKAMAQLRDIIKDDTENIDAYILYADILRMLGYYTRAAKIHKDLTLRDNLTPEITQKIHRSLLQDLIEGKHYKQALQTADDVLNLSKDDLWALKIKLQSLEELGEWKKASDTAKKIQSISGKPDKEMLALYKASEGLEILKNGGKEHDARIRYRESIKLDPKLPLPYIELALSYIRDERAEDAVKELEELISENPAQGYLCFGLLEKTLFELNRFQELERFYRNLRDKHPDNTRIVVAFAKFLDRKGETSEAIKICREGLELKPESLWIRRNLFKFLASRKSYKEAVETGVEILHMITNEEDEFVCSECSYISDRPLWKCPRCGKWRTFKF